MTREQRFKRLKITEKIIIMWLYTAFPGSWQSLLLGLDKHIIAWWRCGAVCLSVAHVVNDNSFCRHFSLLETVGKRKRNWLSKQPTAVISELGRWGWISTSRRVSRAQWAQSQHQHPHKVLSQRKHLHIPTGYPQHSQRGTTLVSIQKFIMCILKTPRKSILTFLHKTLSN